MFKFYLIENGLSPKGEHHPWASRDYEDKDCSAIACQFHGGNGKCGIPSLCIITEEGKCKNFTPKHTPKILDGD